MGTAVRTRGRTRPRRVLPLLRRRRTVTGLWPGPRALRVLRSRVVLAVASTGRRPGRVRPRWVATGPTRWARERLRLPRALPVAVSTCPERGRVRLRRVVAWRAPVTTPVTGGRRTVPGRRLPVTAGAVPVRLRGAEAGAAPVVRTPHRRSAGPGVLPGPTRAMARTSRPLPTVFRPCPSGRLRGPGPTPTRPVPTTRPSRCRRRCSLRRSPGPTRTTFRRRVCRRRPGRR